MKLFAFAASVREKSLNRKLLAIATAEAHKLGAVVDVASFRELDVPLYDGDNEKDIPQGTLEFKRRLDACDAFLICSPEYNHSIPGRLKNAIDWASRLRPEPYGKKPCLLMSASPSLVGGARGLAHLREALLPAGTFVYPESFSLAQADKHLSSEDGYITDPMLMERLRRNVSGFLDFVRRFSNVT